MIVADIIEDLRSLFESRPEAEAWRVGVAKYEDDGEISVMYIAACHADADGDFLLVPEGMGASFDLDESELTAGALLRAIGEASWAEFPAYTHAEMVTLPDGSMATRTQPLWSTGVHVPAELVYFYYGAAPAE